MEKKFEVNKELINDASSMKLYKYLFGEENDSKTVDFRFIVLDIKNSDEKERIASVFLDVFAVSTLLYIDKRPIVFYSEEQDFEVKNLLWSIIDDFGINMSIFNSGKIMNRESFFTVLSLFEKYIARKNYQYYGVSDLILEIVKEDIKELSKYR
ncbi:MAG: hypothetical protein PHO86_05765, partial [Bacilli bacterium]|nr:hypothetical protein [Bacilli bacterium]